MDTRLLGTFLAVAETGSVTQAARALGYTQPAVSRQVAALEHLLGGRLFDRSHQPLALTPFGSSIYPHARATLLLIDDLLVLVSRQRMR